MVLCWQSHWFLFQSRKVDGNKVTHYHRNRSRVKRFSQKANDLVRLQSIASAWYSLKSVLLGKHLLFKENLQKQMYDHLIWFAATVVESKLKQCSH